MVGARVRIRGVVKRHGFAGVGQATRSHNRLQPLVHRCGFGSVTRFQRNGMAGQMGNAKTTSEPDHEGDEEKNCPTPVRFPVPRMVLIVENNGSVFSIRRARIPGVKRNSRMPFLVSNPTSTRSTSMSNSIWPTSVRERIPLFGIAAPQESLQAKGNG